MKTYRYLTVSLGVMYIIFFNSCERWNCIEGNNIYASEERQTGNFSGVQLDGSFDVYINNDTIPGVVVEGDENLLRYISTSVKGNILEINNASRLRITIFFILSMKPYFHTNLISDRLLPSGKS